MNDYEYTFRQTVKERKQSSIAARHIKKGSRTKKVTLPSDFMTKKEINAMNSDIKAINFNAPIAWQDFLTFSESTQRQYVQHLIDEYGCTFNQVYSNVFHYGAAYTAVKSHLNGLGLFTDVSKEKHSRMTDEQRRRWLDEFVRPSSPALPAPPVMETPAPTPTLSLMQVMVEGQIMLKGKASELATLIPAVFGKGVCTADISCANDLDRTVSVTGLTATDVASMLKFFSDDDIVGVHLGFEGRDEEGGVA